jgi:hypothetical protein
MIKKNLSSYKKNATEKYKYKLEAILRKNSFVNLDYNKILKQGILKKNLNYTIDIKITPNNIFCILKNYNTTLILLTAGILKLKLTKRKLKFVCKLLITKFIKNLKKNLQDKTTFLNISGPIKLVQKVIIQFSNEFNASSFIVNIKNKKSFNGCRSKKIRKKKRKGLRVRA